MARSVSRRAITAPEDEAPLKRQVELFVDSLGCDSHRVFERGPVSNP